MKHKIILVKEEDSEPYIAWASDADMYDKDQILSKNPKPTLEELAEFLDQDAENANYHDFVGVHETLSSILRRRCPAVAMEVMMEIISRGGLCQMGH